MLKLIKNQCHNWYRKRPWKSFILLFFLDGKISKIHCKSIIFESSATCVRQRKGYTKNIKNYTKIHSKIYETSIPKSIPKSMKNLWNIDKGTTNPTNIPPNCSVRKLFTLLGHFLKILEKISRTSFEPCPHKEFNTTNPNTILKTTLCFTKYPTKPKYFRNLKK